MDDKPSDNIEIIWRTDRVDLDDSLLARAVRLVLRCHERRCAGICIALVGNDEIAHLNKQYLQHEGPTDVLSFDLGDTPEGAVEGQLVISVDTAISQARQRGHSPEAELMLYCIHGTLHLIGYDDTTEEGASGMHAKEDEFLMELGQGAVYGFGAK